VPETRSDLVLNLGTVIPIEWLNKTKKIMNNTAKIISGVILGTAAGLVTGFLTAPDSGKNTRKKIANKSQDLADEAKEELNKKLDGIKDSYNKILEDSAKKTINGVKTTKKVMKV
jgi:gas vesicle protein